MIAAALGTSKDLVLRAIHQKRKGRDKFGKSGRPTLLNSFEEDKLIQQIAEFRILKGVDPMFSRGFSLKSKFRTILG